MRNARYIIDISIARTGHRGSFFINDPTTTKIYTLSLHDALPIWRAIRRPIARWPLPAAATPANRAARSEEHTSELQSRENLVCRLLLEKKKTNSSSIRFHTEPGASAFTQIHSPPSSRLSTPPNSP